MYWPIGTPRIYATTTAHRPSRSISPVVSHDGLPAGPAATAADAALLSSFESTPAKDGGELNPDDLDAAPLTPGPPRTPATPYIRSVEHDTSKFGSAKPGIHYLGASDPAVVPTHEPVVALKVSRTGHLFAVVTASTLTIWQTKVRIAVLTTPTSSVLTLLFPCPAHRYSRHRRSI